MLGKGFKQNNPLRKPTHTRFDSTKVLLDNIDKLTLPTQKSTPKKEITDYTFFIYGERKIGKTSLLSQFNAFMLEFEPGGGALELYQRPVPIWEHFLQYLDLLLTDNEYSSVCIDTGKTAYDICLDYCSRIYGFSHPGEMEDYGASWGKVNSEFQRAHNKLFSLGKGVIVIAHSTIRKIESYSGIKCDTIVPDLSGGSVAYYQAIMDNIFYYQFVKSERFLRIRGDELITAGTRCKYNFKTPKGDAIYFIPMGNSEEQGYRNLVRAFNNKQEKTYKEFLKY